MYHSRPGGSNFIMDTNQPIKGTISTTKSSHNTNSNMSSLSIVGIKVTINPTIPRMKKIQSAIRLLFTFFL